MRRAVAGALLALFLSACAGPAPVAARPGPAWSGADGEPVPADVLSVFAAPGACDAPGAAFLELDWPLPGMETDDAPERRQYARDPQNTLDTTRLLAPYDEGSTLSRDTAYTGYHTDVFQLWAGADADIYLYLVDGPRVEAWPRVEVPFACAAS